MAYKNKTTDYIKNPFLKGNGHVISYWLPTIFCVILFINSYSTFAQIKFPAYTNGYVNPTLLVSLSDQDIFFEKGEIISNVLKITNTTKQQLSFYIELSLPLKWRTLTKSNRLYEINANDTMFIPIRIIPGELSKGNTKYMFGIFIFSEEGKQINYCYFLANTKKLTKWTLDVLPHSKLYFLNNTNNIDFTVNLFNMGNEDQDILLSFKNIGSNSYISDTLDKALKQNTNTFNLQTNTDTTFFYRMNYVELARNLKMVDLENYNPFIRNEEKKYSLFVNSMVPKQNEKNRFSANKRIDFVKLSNTKKINPYANKTLPLIIDISTFNILGDYPMMNIMMKGNTVLENKSSLIYFTQISFATNYFSSAPFTNLPLYIGYFHKKISIEVGDVGYYGGKGIRARYSIGKNQSLGAYVSKSPSLFKPAKQFAFGLSHEWKISDQFNIFNQYNHISFSDQKINSDMIQTNLNIRFLKNHFINVTLAGCQNYNYFRSDSAFFNYGYNIGVNYGTNFLKSKYSTRLNLMYYSPDFQSLGSNSNIENNRERFLASWNSAVKVNKSWGLDLISNYTRYAVNIYIPKYSYYYNSNLFNQLNLVRQSSNGMSFSQNLFYNIYEYDRFLSHSRGLGLGFSKFNLTNNNRYYVNLKVGYNQAIKYSDNKNYFFLQTSLVTQYRTFTLNTRYNYGYTSLNKFMYISLTKYPQLLGLSMRYQYVFSNPSFVLTPNASFSYSNLTGSNLNFNPELYYYTRTGWRFNVLTEFNIGFRGNNEQAGYFYNYQNSENQASNNKTRYNFSLGFNIRKEFGIPIPSKKHLFSTVEFLVFQDVNGNHIWDKSEDLLENVVISVNNHEVVTNDKGFAKLENLEVGNYPFTVFSLTDLNGWFPNKEDTISTVVKNYTKYIPFTRGVKLYGAVLMDREQYTANSDVPIDLSKIKISAYDGKVYTTLTSKDGSYLFYLPYGKYTLTLDETVLGDKFILTQNNFEINVSNEIDNLYLPFYIIEKKRRVVKKKFDSQGNVITVTEQNTNSQKKPTKTYPDSSQLNLFKNQDVKPIINNDKKQPEKTIKPNNNVQPNNNPVKDTNLINSLFSNPNKDIQKNPVQPNNATTPQIVEMSDQGEVNKQDINDIRNLIKAKNNPNANSNTNDLFNDNTFRILDADKNNLQNGIQIKASKRRLTADYFRDTMKAVYDNYKQIYEIVDTNNKEFPYKYLIGNYQTFEEAKKANEEIKKVLPGTFVSKYGKGTTENVNQNTNLNANDLRLNGLTFRVQISSSIKKVDPEYFTNKYNIQDTIFLYMSQQKVYKYSMGTLFTYQEATDYKIDLMKKYNVSGFITPYFHNRRISFEQLVDIINKIYLEK